MQTKTCTKCEASKPVTDFYKQKGGKYGVGSICKICQKLKDKLRRDTDEFRAKHAEQQKNWRHNNPEKHRASVLANIVNIRESHKQCGRRWRAKDPERHLYYKVKYTSKSKNLPFNIDVADILIPEFCPMLGIPLVTGGKGSACSPNLATVDRLIPELGYVKGNINVVSFRANRIKNDATLEELEAITRYVKEATKSQSDTYTKAESNSEQEEKG